MATSNNPYQSVKLTSAVDYKFLAMLVADKLKNEKYKKEWKIMFIKNLFEQLKPLLSFEGIERLQKTVQDLFFQKQKTEKELVAAQKAAAEVKKSESRANVKKGHIRVSGGAKDKFGNYLDDAPSDDSDDDY